MTNNYKARSPRKLRAHAAWNYKTERKRKKGKKKKTGKKKRKGKKREKGEEIEEKYIKR